MDMDSVHTQCGHVAALEADTNTSTQHDDAMRYDSFYVCVVSGVCWLLCGVMHVLWCVVDVVLYAVL